MITATSAPASLGTGGADPVTITGDPSVSASATSNAIVLVPVPTT